VDTIVLQAGMRIEDLASGFTLTSGSGLAEFTIRADSFGRELSG